MAAARPNRESAGADQKLDYNTRARLLHAATECFAEHGYQGTSTREIANRAQVAQQLITYHFGSKERLWEAAVEYLHQELLQTMEALRFDETQEAVEQFRHHQRLMLRDRIERPHMARIWTQELLSNQERFSRVIMPILRNFAKTIADPYFEEVLRLGIGTRFSAGEVKLICTAIVQLNVLSPFFVESALGERSGSAAAIDQQIDLLVRILTGEREGAELPPPHGSDEITELKQVIAELTLENRRLRRALEPGDATVEGAQTHQS